MIPTRYDADIRKLERELRALKGLQRRERKAVEPRKPRKAKPKRPAAVEAYWALLREIGCVVTGRTDDLTLHHVHSGSIADMGITRGGGQKSSDYLVIPLHRELHCIGPNAIDGAKGVRTWEAQYGTQVAHIDALVARTGIDVWRLAGIKT